MSRFYYGTNILHILLFLILLVDVNSTTQLFRCIGWNITFLPHNMLQIQQNEMKGIIVVVQGVNRSAQ